MRMGTPSNSIGPFSSRKKSAANGSISNPNPHWRKKFWVADHRRGVGMKGSFAAMALDYRGSIDDMIKMSMGEQKELDLFVRESGIGALRSVEKDAALRRRVVKAIGVEDTAGEAFEPIHEKMVREVMSRFDFRESVCKFLAFSI